MYLLETERLRLRRFSVDDTALIVELLNEPSFIQNIRDIGVRTTADAVEYLRNGPMASYERFGFGLYLVELKESGAPIGMCGLVKREGLDDVEIGFAFLPRFWSKGYAAESALVVKSYGLDVFGLPRLVAITNPDNAGSIRVLEKTGLTFERMIRLPGEDIDIRLYTSDDT